MNAEFKMQTYSGRSINPVWPEPEDVSLLDIAHALGKVCRYGGHCSTFYSVAEHSIWVSHYVDPEYALIGLMHDATEAYLGDMVYPAKVQLEDYKKAESRMWWAISERFGLLEKLPQNVKDIDLRVVVDEKKALMVDNGPWSSLEGIEGCDFIPQCLSPRAAITLFLRRAAELGLEQ